MQIILKNQLDLWNPSMISRVYFYSTLGTQLSKKLSEKESTANISHLESTDMLTLHKTLHLVVFSYHQDVKI